MKSIFHRLKPLSFSLFVVIVVWGAFSIGREGVVKYEILITGQDASKPSSPIVDEGDAVPVCSITGPMGPWDHYQMRDLPRGDCFSAQVCTLWTKDSCHGTNYPGPLIKWKCVCDSGMWRCNEQERTKAACIPVNGS